MSEAAHVTSIPALVELRATLATFADEARDALASVEMEIRRTFDWLAAQLQAWKQEVRRAEDAVFNAQQELARRKMMKVGDRPVDCTEQEKALRLARARLDHAEDQYARTRTWLRDLPTEVTEYEGRAKQLQGLVEGGLSRTCGLLERTIADLEAYVGLRALPPAGERNAP
jgi:chromosome segregation ATPase